MIILNKKLTPENFRKYIKEMKIPFWHRRIDKLVFHHTSSAVEIWQGSASMLHYWNLYCSRGWKNGPHIFIAPDAIWLFTPISKQGRHAGPVGDKGSIGIEIVGRYTIHPPRDEDLCANIALVTYILMKKFNIKPNELKSHLEYDSLSFCSPAINTIWIYENLIRFYPYAFYEN